MSARLVLRAPRAAAVQVAGVCTFKKTDGTPTRTIVIQERTLIKRLWKAHEFVCEAEIIDSNHA